MRVRTNLVRAGFVGLRDAVWLSPSRARGYCVVLLAATTLLWSGHVVLAIWNGGWDLSGKPLGTDFLCFWSAARLAVLGHPSDAYRPLVQYGLERAAFGNRDTGYYAFIYPPVTLLLCWPLGLLPYVPALLAWLGVTGSAYLAVVSRCLGRTRYGWVPIAAFPAVLLTLGHGQNAFLTTALFGGGFLLLKRHPIAAGMLLGTLVIKPHLGLLIPVYLVAGGYGIAFVAAGAAVLAWASLSVLAFGTETWTAYRNAAALARATLEQGLVEPEKLQSVFAAIRLWGGSVVLAYGAQAAVAIAAAIAVAVLARRRPDPILGVAALIPAALLTTPYVLDYDLTLLAVPLAVLAAQARRSDFQPWEKLIGLAAFCLPLVSRLVALSCAVPLGPPIVVLVFSVLWRRALASVPTARAGLPTSSLPSRPLGHPA